MLRLLTDSSVLLYLVATATICLLILFRRYLRVLWLMTKLPGPDAYPIIGNANWIIDHKRLHTSSYTAREDYGPIIRVWISFFPMLLLLDPMHIQKVLGSSKQVGKTFFYRMLHTFLGEGLITSDTAKWRVHRKLLQPSFHISILEELVPVFNSGADYFSGLIEKQKTFGSINICPLVNLMVMKTLNEAILGISEDPKMEKTSPFRQGSLKLQYRCLRPWLLLNTIYQLTEGAKREMEHKSSLAACTQKHLVNRLKANKEGTVTKKCYLDYLIKVAENNEGFTEKDIIEEACTLMLAGQDSVGAAISFCLHQLAAHPDIQNLVYKEQSTIFGNSNRPVTAYDVRDMKYLEQCLKETMRIFPSVPLIARELGEDIKINGYTVPAGTSVIIAPFATHRLAEYYPDPKEFKPERFSPEEVEKRHPYAYLPFSAGIRNCIGYRYAMIEMKTIISAIIRKYELTVEPGRENLDLRYRVTLRASGGMWLKFKLRNSVQMESNCDERHL